MHALTFHVCISCLSQKMKANCEKRRRGMKDVSFLLVEISSAPPQCCHRKRFNSPPFQPFSMPRVLSRAFNRFHDCDTLEDIFRSKLFSGASQKRAISRASLGTEAAASLSSPWHATTTLSQVRMTADMLERDIMAFGTIIATRSRWKALVYLCVK